MHQSFPEHTEEFTLSSLPAKWGQMVCRGASVPPSIRTGEVSSGTSHISLQRETRLDLEVESMILVCASAPTPTTVEVIGDSCQAGFAASVFVAPLTGLAFLFPQKKARADPIPSRQYRSGVAPEGWERLMAAAQKSDPSAVVWRYLFLPEFVCTTR